jgi:hypothetical protein
MPRRVAYERRDDRIDRIMLLTWDRYASAVGKMHLDTAHAGNLNGNKAELALSPSWWTNQSFAYPALPLGDCRNSQPLLPIIE